MEDAEDAAATPRNFIVELDPAENAIPQILRTGRSELAATCADRPDASIRVFDPLDPGAFADVPCASMLRDGAAAGEESAAPVSDGDEPVEAVQQALSPLSIGCAAFVLGSSLVAVRAICPRAPNPRDAKRCHNWSDAGFGTLTIMCAFF
ncbi:hypothetical protein ACMHYB_08090 [Sorangium sp. So ce1128]